MKYEILNRVLQNSANQLAKIERKLEFAMDEDGYYPYIILEGNRHNLKVNELDRLTILIEEAYNKGYIAGHTDAQGNSDLLSETDKGANEGTAYQGPTGPTNCANFQEKAEHDKKITIGLPPKTILDLCRFTVEAWAIFEASNGDDDDDKMEALAIEIMSRAGISSRESMEELFKVAQLYVYNNKDV